MPRGGRREGAGRKPRLGPLTPVTIRLTEKDVKLLKRLTKRHEADGPTGAIRAALRVAAKPVKPAPSGDVEPQANAEVLCRAIAAIGAGEEAEVRSALAELGEALGFSSGDKRKVTSALTRARGSLEAAGKTSASGGKESELSIEDEAKRLRQRAAKELKRHPMPVYEDYKRQKKAQKYRVDHERWMRESIVVNAFEEAAGRLEDCIESMRGKHPV